MRLFPKTSSSPKSDCGEYTVQRISMEVGRMTRGGSLGDYAPLDENRISGEHV
jgi:hypothetical protein